MELLVEARPWPSTGDRPARAAVSSFGISGTNAHVVLEGVSDTALRPAPGTDLPGTAEETPADGPSPLPHPWTLSALGADALRAQARRLLDHVARPGLSPADVGHSLATTRSTFEHRAVVLGRTGADLLAGLEALADGTSHPQVITGHAPGSVGTAFVFSGQGAQRLGMGRELAAGVPGFAAALEEVCGFLDPLLERPLGEVMFAGGDGVGAGLLDRTEYTQPALFAVEVALWRLLAGWGVRPDFVAGHSVGEVAAAHVAGVLSLGDAARLVVARGRLMGAARGDGVMVAVGAGKREVAGDLAGVVGVDVAAVNGPGAVVVSGDAGVLEGLVGRWRGRGWRTSRLRVSHAFHSSHMDGVLEEFRGVVGGLRLSDPVVPLVSTVTGAVAGPGELTDPEYWVRQLRGTVRFHDAVRTMKDEGVGLCLEVGPDAVLTGMIRDGQDDGALTAVPLLRARHPETDVLAAGLATAHVHGARVDWAAFFPKAVPTDLPTYAFRHHRYWLTSGKRTEGRAAGADRSWHPLLDMSVDLADRGDTVLGGRVDAEAHPWLADHAIDGNVILPATAFLELGAAVAARTGADRVEQLTLEAPLHLPEGEAAQLQIIVEAAGQDGARAFSVHARPAGQDGEDTGWTRCASGSLVSTGAGPEPDAFAPLRSWPPQGATEIPLDGVYDRLAELGYAYGPTFRGLTRLWRHGEELYAEVGLPTQLHDTAAAFAIHPALLDAAIQPLVVTAAETLASEDLLRLPFDWQGAAFWSTGTPTALRVRLTPAGGDDVSVAVADQHGAPVAQARALTMRPVSRESFTARFGAADSAVHALRWESVGSGLVGGGVSGGLVFVGEGLPGLVDE
ncbi:acyltransferase domain-containing protein, partial [Streptomyces sp. NPDC005930]|uniref:acyltransferase domain-containing protein n=1 Tax=Streptomyces sp. NPDC005930 TaxID=3364736 RepID=UPI0036A27148